MPKIHEEQTIKILKTVSNPVLARPCLPCFSLALVTVQPDTAEETCYVYGCSARHVCLQDRMCDLVYLHVSDRSFY